MSTSQAPGEQDPVAAIQSLLERCDTKEALALAKRYHKERPTPESEEVLLGVYRARLEALRRAGLEAEAVHLETIVLERFPRFRQVPSAGETAAVLPLERLVEPLAKPDLPPEERARIEATVRRILVDPQRLAACPTLPADHPLRLAAQVAAQAFERVTSGPIEPGSLDLERIPRRGPLGPWKALVAAIAAYYRREDADCLRWIAAIDTDSPPGRFAPVLRALVSPEEPPPRSTLAVRLFDRVSGAARALAEPCKAVDRALRSFQPHALQKTVRNALEACRHAAPDRVEWLKQHIAVRCSHQDVPTGVASPALGDPPVRDASYWRLFAHEAEIQHDRVLASLCWDQFRRQAIRQRWFGEASAGAASVDMRAAVLVSGLPAREVLEARRHLGCLEAEMQEAYARQPPEVAKVAWLNKSRRRLDPAFLDAGSLFRRACAADPRPAYFRRWIEWLRSTYRPGNALETAAQAWHAERPTDLEPIQTLLDLAEKRGAHQKALRLLDEALHIAPHDPGIRQARTRLHVAVALRHLRSGRLDLLEDDVTRVVSIDDLSREDRSIVQLAFAHLGRSGSVPLDPDPFAELSRLLGGEPGARLLLLSLSRRSGVEPGLPGEGETVAATPELLESTARACRWLASVAVEAVFPPGWISPLVLACRDHPGRVGGDGLATLAREALAARCVDLAHAATAAGLNLKGPSTSAFLLLRARCVESHSRACLAARAALSLARRDRAVDVVADAIEFLREKGALEIPCQGSKPPDLERELAMSPAQVDDLITREIEAASWSLPRVPASRRAPKPPSDVQAALPFTGSLRPARRRRRRAPPGPAPTPPPAPAQPPRQPTTFPPEITDEVVRKIIESQGLPAPIARELLHFVLTSPGVDLADTAAFLDEHPELARQIEEHLRTLAPGSPGRRRRRRRPTLPME